MKLEKLDELVFMFDSALPWKQADFLMQAITCIALKHKKVLDVVINAENWILQLRDCVSKRDARAIEKFCKETDLGDEEEAYSLYLQAWRFQHDSYDQKIYILICGSILTMISKLFGTGQLENVTSMFSEYFTTQEDLIENLELAFEVNEFGCFANAHIHLLQ